MRRDLEAMSAKSHDLVIVGGGVTGSAIAWDASLRGLAVALVEKDDFAHATTAGSSKLIHGGLRYLVNGEFRLVREALRERRIWQTIAPHMVSPMPFILPTYGRGARGRLALSLGLGLYDLLAYDRNRLDDDEQRIAAYRGLSREQALRLVPFLRKDGLTGAKLYYDCQMFAPERLSLEFLLGAVERGAAVANYAPVTGFAREDAVSGARVTGVRVTDGVTGRGHLVRGRVTVNASGPWADRMMALAADGPPARPLMRSKGIHLITRGLSGDHALAVRSARGGHFFVLPWRGHSILGTTDTPFEGEPDGVGVTEADIADFLDVVNDGLPGLGLGRGDVLYAYAGLRPLVGAGPGGAKDAADSYRASRRAEVCDHAREDAAPVGGLISAIGGKWTTSRALAERVVDLAVEKLGGPRRPCRTRVTPLYGGGTGPYRQFVEQAAARHGDLPREAVETLAHYHGARLDEVLATADERPDEAGALLRPLGGGRADLAVQVAHAVRREMALHLDDVLLRRTGLGTLGDPGGAITEKVAALMGRELGWDAARRRAEVDRAAAAFVPAAKAAA